MKSNIFKSKINRKNFLLNSEINAQFNSKNIFYNRHRIKSAKPNKYNRRLILSPNNNEIKNNDSKDGLNTFNNDNKYMKTFNSEKNSICDNFKNNLKTLKTEVKDKSIFDKNNNYSLYSTLWYNEEPKIPKTYYFLNNKKNEKMMKDLLKRAEKFYKRDNNRFLIGIVNKYKNKAINVGEHKKFQQFTYKKRIPINVAFGLGKSNNENLEICNNYIFNKRLKQQKIRKLHLSNKMNNLYKNGYNLETDPGLIKNSQKSFSKSSPKTIFITDSSANKLHLKDSFGKEIYSVLTKHKILKNILPNEVEYNTKTSIEDIINSEIHPLLRHQKKVLVQNTNLISQELNILFGKFIRLCKKKTKFGEKEERIELKTNDKFIELMRSLIKKNEIEEEKKIVKDNEEEEIKNKIERRKYLLNKFKDIIILAYQKIKKFNIDINIFYSLMDYNKNDPNFQMELILNGQYLFKAIKAGDIPEIIKYIDRNKYLVAYKDDFNQIPLHICAKRNLYQLIYFFLSRLSSIDAQDLGGRTPLMIAAQNNFFEFVTILLFEGADPNIKDVNGNLASQLTNNDKLRILLRRAEILNNLKYFIKGKNFQDFIINGLDFLFKKELEIDYEDWFKKGERILKEFC